MGPSYAQDASSLSKCVLVCGKAARAGARVLCKFIAKITRACSGLHLLAIHSSLLAFFSCCKCLEKSALKLNW